MATYYIDPTNGNDADDGLSWANAFLTLNGCEDEPVAAGDIVWVGPGVYRELLTVDVSGGNTYAVGTVSVTKASDQVIGNGTAWVANVAADYYFHVRYYDNGADGVTDGTLTFTAAGGNFQADMVGMPIQINTRGAYTIGAVGAANTLTLVDVNGLGNPAAAGGLTYSIMSGEGHYEIESVDDNTTITLKQPWQGRTLTGLSYLTFNGITYIADVTGENTDSVGGIVRITGSDDDQGEDRASCIVGTVGDDYRVFRGFRFDTVSGDLISVTDCVHWVIEDCVFGASASSAVYTAMATNITIRRCKSFPTSNFTLEITSAGTLDDSGYVIENCLAFGGATEWCRILRVGGMTFRNITMTAAFTGIRVLVGPATGQTALVSNCILNGCNIALRAAALGEITEDHNTFYSNQTNRNTVATGANSVTYPWLPLMPILFAGVDQLSGFKFPGRFGELSEWSQVAAITGADERNTDLLGIRRPTTAAKNSWGALQFADMRREIGTVQAGSVSMAMPDAGRVQFWMPVSAVSTTITVYAYWEVDYAGTRPQMVIKQPGQSDRVTLAAAGAEVQKQLSDTFTPAATPPYVIVELVSNNTAAAGDYKIFWDTLRAS